MEKTDLKQIINDIYDKLDYLNEEILKNRKIIVELIEQGNLILEFMESSDKEFLIEEIKSKKFKKHNIYTSDLNESFTSKSNELLDLENELANYSGSFTSGQVGET